MHYSKLKTVLSASKYFLFIILPGYFFVTEMITRLDCKYPDYLIYKKFLNDSLTVNDTYWMLVTDYWMLVTGCWILVT